MNYPSVDGSLAERPQTQVEEQINRFETLNVDLAKIVAVLQERLSGVCRVTEKNEKPQATPRPVLVPLAEKLYSIGETFGESINALRDLNAGIELPF